MMQNKRKSAKMHGKVQEKTGELEDKSGPPKKRRKFASLKGVKRTSRATGKSNDGKTKTRKSFKHVYSKLVTSQN